MCVWGGCVSLFLYWNKFSKHETNLDNNMLHVMVYHFVSFVVAKCFDTISLHPFPSRSVFYSRTDKSVRTNHSKCMLRIYSTDSICCSEKLNFIRTQFIFTQTNGKQLTHFRDDSFIPKKRRKRRKITSEIVSLTRAVGMYTMYLGTFQNNIVHKY